MVDSVHTARWLNMFSNEDIDFFLLRSTPNRKVHTEIKKLIVTSRSQNSSVTVIPLSGKLSIPLWGIDFMFSNWLRGLILNLYIRRIAPDYVHALELNHGGYILSLAKSIGVDDEPKLIATNWGSDIFWFQRYPRHLRKIRRLLTQIDFYSAECSRDIELASKYGFSGVAHEVFPNAGGFTEQILTEPATLTSERKLILVKGYESFVGRASVALSAIELISDQVRNFEIVVYSANKKTSKLVQGLNKKENLNIKVFPKKKLSHDEMLNLFKRARVYVGISLSDGISTSLLEAIATGAFPIQTDTSCANEWIINGKTGFIVKPEVLQVSESICIALDNDELVDRAQIVNQQTSKERLGDLAISAKALSFYKN
jgi:glycosyltransferase involved in cell wall biosynthesis